MKIVTVIGARPQFIKASVVSRALAQKGMEEVILHTGQHYDPNMSDIFFSQMGIPAPAYNLGAGGGSHGAMTGKQLIGIEEVLLTEKPDAVLVYGDTNSTLAGALAAVKLHIPVVHVEAGLRSYNKKMPEEINRIVADRVSDLLLAPTEGARRNLINEGCAPDTIVVTGDVMYDAALYFRQFARKPDWFDEQGSTPGEYALCTIHRAENLANPQRLGTLFDGLAASGVSFILPLHPGTRAKIQHMGVALPANVRVVEPVGYLEMIWLESNAALVVTDSGGVQKEACFHGKNCVTLRDETEWVELVEAGVNRLAGDSAEQVAAAIQDMHQRPFAGVSDTLYGNGHAAELIADSLYQLLN